MELLQTTMTQKTTKKKQQKKEEKVSYHLHRSIMMPEDIYQLKIKNKIKPLLPNQPLPVIGCHRSTLSDANQYQTTHPGIHGFLVIPLKGMID